ncbi:hypothetical protein E8E11_004221 [Didymella keratinophila]|nr:hypothetical protein E8E11_004221 [Didymella keratinophila]
MQAAPELTVRDTPEGTIDCGFCTGMFDFCVQNGHTRGQEGCKQSCREHVCHRTPECKKCHGDFDKCPEKPRYVN